MKMAVYDVFLSHNSIDKPAVEEIANRLIQKKIVPWFDKWNIIPGAPWQEAIESALTKCATCAVFIGPSGIGPWQNEEMRAAIDRRVHEGQFRVIPVLLPGAKREKRSRLPSFMVATTWVEFPKTINDDEAFRRLVAGIKGKEPGRKLSKSKVENINPYRGLKPFKPKHAPFFFGREALTEWLLNELKPTPGINYPNRFLAIIGNSGSGKSSLALAGLVPALKQGQIKGSGQWPIVIFRPGQDPLESLVVALRAEPSVRDFIPSVNDLVSELIKNRRALHLIVREAFHKVSGTRRMVVMIDQFEEIFTLCQDEILRNAFVENLLYASNVVRGKMISILTMRTDFYSKCSSYEDLAAAMSDHQVLVPPMDDTELRKAIQSPAHMVGCDLEDGLVEILINDINNQPGSLPLLQHALSELWDRRRGRWLTHDAYKSIGNLQGALEKHANSVFEKFSHIEQQICRQIFLRLTQPGEGTEDTKRRATIKELKTNIAEDDLIFKVIRSLTDFRLLTIEGEKECTENSYVEIAHEALIPGWPLLRSWIESDREALRTHLKLSDAALEWEKTGYDESYLYRGIRLAEAEEWLSSNNHLINAIEHKFIQTSIDIRNNIISKEKNRQAKLRLRAFVATVAAFVAMFAAGFATYSYNKADKQSEIAKKEKIKTQSLLNKNYISNALLGKNNQDSLKYLHFTSKAGILSTKKSQVKNAVYNIQSHLVCFLRNIIEHGDNVKSAQFNKDGSRVLTLSYSGAAKLWNTADSDLVGEPMRHDSFIIGTVFNLNENRILTWSHDGTAKLWNAKNCAPIGQPMKHDDSHDNPLFNHNGTRLLTWGNRGTVKLWDAVEGIPVGQPMEHGDSVVGAVFNQDEKLILTWGRSGTAKLWDAADGVLIGMPMKHANAANNVMADKIDLLVRGAIFSHDESRILTWGNDHTAKMWNVKTCSLIGHPMKHVDIVDSAMFNRNDTRVLTVSQGFNYGTISNEVRLWNATDGTPIGQPLRHDSQLVGKAVFNQDGTRILTCGWRGQTGNDTCWARLWDASDGMPIGQPMKHDDSVYGAVFDRDERRILTWSKDGTVKLWDATDGTPIGQPMVHNGAVDGAMFNQDENWIMTWSEDGTVRLWDTADCAPIGQYLKHGGVVNGAVFSRDESQILTWSSDGTARLWDAIGYGSIWHSMKNDHVVTDCLFNHAGSRFLVRSKDDTVRLMDAKDGSPIGQHMKHDGYVRGAVFNQDDKRILTWSHDGTARLWNTKDGTPIGQPMMHDSYVYDAVFNQDGNLILTWSTGSMAENWCGKARLWDASNGKPIGRLMKHNRLANGWLHNQLNIPNGEAVFSQDGGSILTWGTDGTARMWGATDGAPIGQPMKHDSFIEGAVFSHDTKRILTWSNNGPAGNDGGSAFLWDATKGESIGQPLKHSRSIRGAIFNQNGTRILTRDGEFFDKKSEARLWNAKNVAPVGKPMKHNHVVTIAKFYHDGTRILTSSSAFGSFVLNRVSKLYLWDASDGMPIGQPMKHDDSVYGAVFDRDERRILTWSKDGTVKLWDATDGTPIGQPMVHNGAVDGAMFNQDENWIMTWSEDGTVRLWDTADCVPIGQYLKHGGRVESASFNQKESRILTLSEGGTAQLWNIEADVDFPKDHLPLFVRVATGTTMDDYGNVTALSKRKWDELRQEYIKIAERHTENCKYKNANIYLKYQKPNWVESGF